MSKTALGYFLQFMRSQTPIWATIALTVVCCIYIYLKTANTKAMLSKKGPLFDASSSSQPQNSNREVPLSEIHYKVLALLFKSPSTIEYICKALKIDEEEANYYLNDLYNKDMVSQPTAYTSGPEKWRIAQDGREYIMNQRKTE
jgi:predicted HTH transcriptional regulator